MSKVVLQPSKLKIALALVGTLAIVSLGVLTLQLPGLNAKIVGVLSIGVFGYFFIVGLKALFTNGLTLIIDESGIKESNQRYGLIAWDDIEGFDFQRRMILIKVKNVDKYVERLSKFAQATRWLDGGLELGLLSVPISFLGIDSDGIQRILSTMAPDGSIRVIDKNKLDPINI